MWTVAEVARAVEEDSHQLSTGLQKLAHFGAHGKCAGNTERDFQRWVRGAYGFELEPYTIKLTLEEPYPHFGSAFYLFRR